MSPLEGDALPFQKPQQLARGPKKRGRQKASKRRWEEIAAKKGGPCRVCGGNPPNELHHIVSRAQGGSDTEANIVPLCHECHGRITAYDRAACAALRRSLSDAEYSYGVDKLGEMRFESRYPVRWEVA